MQRTIQCLLVFVVAFVTAAVSPCEISTFVPPASLSTSACSRGIHPMLTARRRLIVRHGRNNDKHQTSRIASPPLLSSSPRSSNAFRNIPKTRALSSSSSSKTSRLSLFKNNNNDNESSSFGESMTNKINNNLSSFIPLIFWIVYAYTIFLSTGILPGVNVLHVDQRSLEEARDLSLNVFFIYPLLSPSAAPVVHPLLEGIFNLLLSWAALFAGFASDERKDKPNALNLWVAVVGMQFLTSHFLLPYLATRTPEVEEGEEVVMVYQQDLGKLERVVGESRFYGPIMAGVGIGSVFWGLLARPEFGGFEERYASLIDLLSIDRIGCSLLLDLVVFGIFQGWLVDDDLRRRGVVPGEGGEDDDDSMALLRNVARFVPFLGLPLYFCFRPSLPSRGDI